MANKRPPLELNELTQNLKTSRGQGADAFFSSSPTPITPISPPSKTERKQEGNNATSESNQNNNIINKKIQKETNIVSNITILHITEKDIDDLREPAEKVQSYRLSPDNIEYIRDTAYKLNKDHKRGKIGQGDILRIALVLFDKFMTNNKTELKEILEKIK